MRHPTNLTISTAVGLLVVVTCPFFSLLYFVGGGLGATLAHVSGSSLASSIAVLTALALVLNCLALLAVILFYERQSLGSVGLTKMSGVDLLVAAGAVWFILYTHVLIIRWDLLGVLRGRAGRGGSLLLRLSPYAHRARLTASAAWEELAFRAYLIERVRGLTGNIWIAAAVSAVVSVIWHIPGWGPEQSLLLGGGQLLLILLYVWRRNLPTCFIAHFASNLLPAVLSRLPLEIQSQLLRFLFPL